MSSRSISSELSHKIIIAVAIAVLGGIFGIIEFSGRVVRDAAKQNADASLDTYLKDIKDMFSEVNPMVQFATWQLEVNRNSKDESWLSAVNEKMAQYNDIVVGAEVTPAKYIFGEPVKHSKFSDPYLSEKYGKVVTFSSPLVGEDGTFLGQLDVHIGLDEITSRLRNESFYEGSYSVIISPDGIIASHPDSTLLLRRLSDVAVERNDGKFTELAGKMMSGGRGIGEVRSQKALAIYGPSGAGWSAAIISPGEEIFGGVVKFQLLLLLIAIGDLLVLFFITRAIISRSLIPITEVTYMTKTVAKGDFKIEIPKAEGANEIFHLHEALRNMLKSINDYISQLRVTTAVNERFENELSVARDIQQQMLSTDFINDNEVDLFATLKPAKEVGGDMYDFLRADRCLYFAVGDVSGKGVPAALYMAISRSLFHYVSEMSMSTSSIVSCINNSFCSGNESNMFITMFVGRLDLDTRELVFCNAGHNPIIVISPDGIARYLHSKANLAAGVYDQFAYEKESITVEKGSRLVIYTDGVTEAEAVDKEQYGEERLLHFCESLPTDTPSEVFTDALVKSIKNFTGENDQNDDITIMSVRV